MTTLKDIRFGVEIETIRAGREQTARAVQSVVGGSVRYAGGPYDAWECRAADGRIWRSVNDASLTAAPSHLRSEVVTPILTYDDLETLQEIVRALHKTGARPHQCCGIHIHIDGAAFDAKSLNNLAKIWYKQENLIIAALGTSPDRLRNYTRPMNPEFINRIEQRRPANREEFTEAWYGYRNSNPQHYDQTRYTTMNFHSFAYRGSIECRVFESTLHAGKIKAYVQFCLALGAKALNSRAACSKKREFNPASAKYDFRVLLLGIGMIGKEFKNTRMHLLANLQGSAAWKNGRPAAVNA